MRRFRRMSVLLFAFVLIVSSQSSFAQDHGQKKSQTLDASQKTITARDIRQNIMLFGEIYRLVSMRYVDRIDPEEFLKAGIDGMLSTLDPYTEYVEPEGTEELQIMTSGKYGGVGIRISTRGPERVLTVVSPMEGTPAWRQGIRSGDEIIKIEDEFTKGFSTGDAAKRMRGEPGTTVTLTIRRFGVDEPIEYTLERQEIKVSDVSYSGMIRPGIGYVRLTRFSRNSGTEIKAAIEELLSWEEDGKKQELKGLIFDLRSNPGGLLPEAVSVSENFLKPGDPIVSTHGRIEQMDQQFVAEQEPSLPTDIPLVVMINRGSASASEIVSGAIQDLDRGVIVGRSSFGKGLVQSVMNFKNGQALRMTTAKYYTPSGRLIQKIDYFTDNKSLIRDESVSEEDTLFYTTGGREVVAHGGIVPDVDVEYDEVGELVLQIWSKDLFYSFANDYKNRNEGLSEWSVSDDVVDEFAEFLKEKEFKFESVLRRELNDLKEMADQRESKEEFAEYIEKLEKLTDEEDKREFEKERGEIRERLSLELATVLKGTEGRVKASIDFDPQLQKALEVLSDDDRYSTLLKEGAKVAKAE